MDSKQKDTIRLVHFSDLHLPLKSPIAPWHLLSKRALGFGNLVFNRGKTHRRDLYQQLLGQITREGADLVVITGDVSNLSLPDEFISVDRDFKEAGLNPETTVIIPGNHDRYTPGADITKSFERHLSHWLPGKFSTHNGYPYVKSCGGVSVLALDTAVWRGPARAAGYVSPAQLERVVSLVDREIDRGQHPVIAMHHPPFHLRTALLRDYRSGLDGLEHFIEALSDKLATVLHGHLHKLSRRQTGRLDIFGVPSASNNAGEETKQLGYNVYHYKNGVLKTAETVRFWPQTQHSEISREGFVREEMPSAVFAD